MDLDATAQRLATPTLRRKLREGMKGLREELDLPAIREDLEDPKAREALRAYLMET